MLWILLLAVVDEEFARLELTAEMISDYCTVFDIPEDECSEEAVERMFESNKEGIDTDWDPDEMTREYYATDKPTLNWTFNDRRIPHCCALFGLREMECGENAVKKSFRRMSFYLHSDKKPRNPKEAARKLNELVDCRNFLLGQNVDKDDRAAQLRRSYVSAERHWRHVGEFIEIEIPWVKEAAEKLKRTERILKMRMNESAEEAEPMDSNPDSVNSEDEKQKLTVSHDVIGGDNVEDDTELSKDRQDNIFVEADEESIIGIGDANNKESDEPFESFDNHSVDREEELKESILAALNELDEIFGIDMNEYLMQLQKDYGHSTVAYDAKLFFMVIIAMVAAVYLFAYRSVHTVITKCYINFLLPKDDASVRMAHLRGIIRRNQWIFGHIKTSGKGRTKMKILNELRSMQFA